MVDDVVALARERARSRNLDNRRDLVNQRAIPESKILEAGSTLQVLILSHLRSQPSPNVRRLE